MHSVAARLLAYPDDETLAQRGPLGEAIALADRPARRHLLIFFQWWCGEDAERLRERYVETFDFTSRHSLYLTYHRYGDSRERGRALICFKRFYREAGFSLDGWELPDYLPIVLELCELAPARGAELVADYRPEIEAIARSLRAEASPYAELFAALIATLPRAGDAVRRRVDQLLASEPPVELVGLGDAR